MQQLPRQMAMYIGKNHDHMGKTLPTLVLCDTQIFYFYPMMLRLKQLSLVENTIKHIHLQDHRQEMNTL